MNAMTAPKYRVISGERLQRRRFWPITNEDIALAQARSLALWKSFSVLPGVELIYDDFSMKEQPNAVEVEGNLLKNQLLSPGTAGVPMGL